MTPRARRTLTALVLLIVAVGTLLTLLHLARPSWPAVVARIETEHPRLPAIDTDSLARLMQGDHLLLDARTAEEWQVSHLPGAIRAEDLAAAEEAIGKRRGSVVVIYCAVGLRSADLTADLLAAGHDGIAHLEGGIFTWAAEGRPLIDAEGERTRAVHPYNWYWGRLLGEPFSD